MNSKALGGLDIGSLRACNLALITKWWWRYKDDTEGIWKKVITCIYGDQGGLGVTIPLGKRNTVWGRITNVCKDLEPFNIDLNTLFYRRNDYGGNSNGSKWCWSLDASGDFTVSSLRKEIDKSFLESTNTPTVWTNIVPGKINIFIWRARLGRLPTRANLARRGVGIPSTLCPMCNAFEENEDHIFKYCSTTRELGALLRLWWKDALNENDSLDNLIGVNSIHKKRQQKEIYHGCDL
ncbi:unnamed protein product [Lactuca virosa]|uniref:Reverse transcriptase zinc-binding domain-containing protein n=1 Tax=Lactuca virosa TaxID=75947 RepID=A0AAU9LIJ9_9ASTR|nr:unnamed protein product [Lactuca virosa]